MVKAEVDGEDEGDKAGWNSVARVLRGKLGMMLIVLGGKEEIRDPCIGQAFR